MKTLIRLFCGETASEMKERIRRENAELWERNSLTSWFYQSNQWLIMYLVKIKSPDSEPFISSAWLTLDRAETAAMALDAVHELSDCEIWIEVDKTRFTIDVDNR